MALRTAAALSATEEAARLGGFSLIAAAGRTQRPFERDSTRVFERTRLHVSVFNNAQGAGGRRGQRRRPDLAVDGKHDVASVARLKISARLLSRRDQTVSVPMISGVDLASVIGTSSPKPPRSGARIRWTRARPGPAEFQAADARASAMSRSPASASTFPVLPVRTISAAPTCC